MIKECLSEKRILKTTGIAEDAKPEEWVYREGSGFIYYEEDVKEKTRLCFNSRWRQRI